jgi:hypothetical protein
MNFRANLGALSEGLACDIVTLFDSSGEIFENGFD